MKRQIAFFITFALLSGMLAFSPVMTANAEQPLDSALITHWDFVGEGEDALADKAAAGTSDDTMKLFGKASVSNGAAYIPDWASQCSDHYIYCEDSDDLLRSAEDRTIYIVFKSDKTLDSSKNDHIELAAQNGAFRLGIGSDGKVFGSTNPHSMGENACATDGMNRYAPNTWITVAVAYDKTENSNSFQVSTYFKAGDGDWVTGTASRTDASQTWKEDNSDAGQTDPMSLIFGRRANASGSTWGGNITIDDIRIYNKALTKEEVSSIAVQNSSVICGGHSLTLKGNIGVNFFLKPNTATIQTAATVTVSNGEKLLVTAAFDQTHEAAALPGYYQFTAPVSAKEMTDMLTLTVKTGDTVWYTEQYSVKTYADRVIANEGNEFSAETVALVQAMLNYGGYTQKYFDYSTDRLANSGLSLPLPEVTRDTKTYRAQVSGQVTGVVSVSATLKLESETRIVYVIELENGTAASDFTFEGGTAKINGNTVTVTSDGICAQNLNAMQTLTVTSGSETQTVSYAPMTYLMEKLEDRNTDLADLLHALWAYHTAAAAYLAAI